MSKKQPTRRAVLKKAIYTAPALLTLKALPSFAAAGSGQPIKEDPPGNIVFPPSKEDPPGNVVPPPVKDGPSGSVILPPSWTRPPIKDGPSGRVVLPPPWARPPRKRKKKKSTSS